MANATPFMVITNVVIIVVIILGISYPTNISPIPAIPRISRSTGYPIENSYDPTMGWDFKVTTHTDPWYGTEANLPYQPISFRSLDRSEAYIKTILPAGAFIRWAETPIGRVSPLKGYRRGSASTNIFPNTVPFDIRSSRTRAQALYAHFVAMALCSPLSASIQCPHHIYPAHTPWTVGCLRSRSQALHPPSRATVFVFALLSQHPQRRVVSPGNDNKSALHPFRTYADAVIPVLAYIAQN